MTVKAAIRRCAVYTRKSSEEGLEQDFNSLHAQREACEAFIRSQRGEGWRLLETAPTRLFVFDPGRPANQFGCGVSGNRWLGTPVNINC